MNGRIKAIITALSIGLFLTTAWCVQLTYIDLRLVHEPIKKDTIYVSICGCDSLVKRVNFLQSALNGSLTRRDFLDSFYWYGSTEIDSLIRDKNR